MISPIDIENKVFKISKKGYDKDEVDDYLDLIILDMEKLLLENKKLKTNIEKLEAEKKENVSCEKSVMETLETAKKLVTDISASAEKRAEGLIKNAQMEAEAIKKNAKESIGRLNEESEDLKRRVENVKFRYKSMLEAELDRFNVVSDDLLKEIEQDLLESENNDKDMTINSFNNSSSDITKTGVVKRERLDLQARFAEPDLTKTRVIK